MNAEIDRAKSASMSAIRVAVGSLNPVKVGAVRAAIERSALRPASLEVLGFDVPVACQTSRGRPESGRAQHRARSAAPTLSGRARSLA